jgi:hypothetical protein
MSFVTTNPEALLYAAGKLQTIGSAMAAESAAVAAPTTGVVPAAADEVSALQAAIFAAYGSLYQSVNAQATANHELFVHTLGTSARSYTATESANSADRVTGRDLWPLRFCRKGGCRWPARPGDELRRFGVRGLGLDRCAGGVCAGVNGGSWDAGDGHRRKRSRLRGTPVRIQAHCDAEIGCRIRRRKAWSTQSNWATTPSIMASGSC